MGMPHITVLRRGLLRGLTFAFYCGDDPFQNKELISRFVKSYSVSNRPFIACAPQSVA